MKLLFIGCVILLWVLSQLGNVQACDKNVQKVTTGTTINCTGWLVSEPTMQEITKNKDQLELNQKLVDQQKQLLKLSNEEIEFYKVQSQSRAKELNKAEIKQFWSNLGYFTLGVVMTGLATKAAIEASK